MTQTKTKTAKKKGLNPQQQSTVDTAKAITKKVDGNALTFDGALQKGKQLIADGLQQITATLAMRDLTPIQVRDVFDFSAGVNDAVEEAKKLARARILDLALKQGEPTGTTGASRKLVFPDGRTLLAKATKTGTDPKKFEAAIRAKGLEVTKYMVPTVTYKLPTDFDGPKQAIDDGVFTADEVEQMAYEPSYAVERSKEGKEE